MLFLMIPIFLALAVATWLCLSRFLADEASEKESDLASLAASLQQILTSKKDIERDIVSLNAVLSRTLRMYEAARDICATLDETKLFERFKEDLKKLIDYGECRLLKDEKEVVPSGGGAQDFLEPLTVSDTHFGYLYVKGVCGGDRPYLGILARHFALGLKRSKLYRMTQELAITDSLTGLFTRRYAAERLGEELKRSEAQGTPLSFFMIDADNFKECNDRYGHIVGDMVLTEISRHIRDNVREIDMLARFGGEEFMVFAPRTNKESASLIAERIRRSIAESVIHAYDEHLKMTVSIGLAAFPEDALKMEDLIGKADWALYQAKKLGKDRVYVFGTFKESL
jgi:diguanylate cyclase (GGDEF)-like protein